mmetsp:Transcript_30472/g.75013  ORF Transcript_30472/g.75013 Transcript_30472/m.75013 type:complete len:140 (-) Transcript_30472:598-1017(-)
MSCSGTEGPATRELQCIDLFTCRTSRAERARACPCVPCPSTGANPTLRRRALALAMTAPLLRDQLLCTTALLNDLNRAAFSLRAPKDLALAQLCSQHLPPCPRAVRSSVARPALGARHARGIEGIEQANTAVVPGIQTP